MNTSLGIDFWLKVSWSVGELSATDDVEVIICCVTAGVAFCANGSTYYGVRYDGNVGSNIDEPKMIKYSVMPVTSQQNLCMKGSPRLRLNKEDSLA